jgi:8-hydroxy-5-deazaflavin:NADPH oxidoreductase
MSKLSLNKIAILGTGNVGQAIAKALTSKSYNVTVGTRNVSETMTKDKPDNMGNLPISELLEDNNSIKLSTFQEAVMDADLIILAVGGSNVMNVLDLAGPIKAETVVIDITNPLDFSKGFPQSLFTDSSESLAEKIQTKYPYIKLVKSLNTMANSIMLNPNILKDQGSNFICGNDAGAKDMVKELFVTFGWDQSSIIDLGDLTGSRGMEMILPLWIKIFQSRGNANFNFKIVE